MTRKVTIDLTKDGFAKLNREIENYQSWLRSKAGELLDRLADIGLEAASAGFGSAQYDGTNDVTVTVDDRGENVRAIVASGGAALFIEFGTGIVYPNDHPEAGELGMTRGSYGAGHGNQKTWGYYGEPGTNGVVKEKGNGMTVVLTHGNPANKPMYNSAKMLEEDLERIAMEVFGSD